MKPWLIVLVVVIAILLFMAIAGICGYRMVVHPKAPQVDARKRHFLFIGDSITFGSGVVPKQKKLRFSRLLQNKLGNEIQVLNYGLSGRTLLEEGDVPYVKEKFYSLSKEVPAEKIFIMLGTNDSKPYNWKGKEKYKEEYLSFIASYRKNSPKAQFYLGLCPKAHLNKKKGVVIYDIDEKVIRDEIIPTIKEVAEEAGAKTIDFYSLTKDHPEYFADGVHPNQLGNEVIADFLCSQIK